MHGWRTPRGGLDAGELRGDEARRSGGDDRDEDVMRDAAAARNDEDFAGDRAALGDRTARDDRTTRCELAREARASHLRCRRTDAAIGWPIRAVDGAHRDGGEQADDDEGGDPPHDAQVITYASIYTSIGHASERRSGAIAAKPARSRAAVGRLLESRAVAARSSSASGPSRGSRSRVASTAAAGCFEK